MVGIPISVQVEESSGKFSMKLKNSMKHWGNKKD